MAIDEALVGLTPKVAKIHFNDLLSNWELHISWQLVTPFGAFPQMEEKLTLGDLSAVINTIKTIWAIVSDGDPSPSPIFAPLGDLQSAWTLPDGGAVRREAVATFPDVTVGDISVPDEMPDYDGVEDSWGATGP